MGLPVKGVFERGLIVVDSTYMIVYMYCPTALHCTALHCATSRTVLSYLSPSDNTDLLPMAPIDAWLDEDMQGQYSDVPLVIGE